MFRNIILVYKSNLENHLFEKIEEIKSNFENSNFLVVDYDSLREEIIEKADLVITLGGDGTFIKAANLLEDAYILGINAEPCKSEGALITINANEIEKLKDIQTKKFKVKELQRADIILNGKVLDERALNEIYIGTRTQFHSSRYKIKFKGQEEEQRSSGILVSTGTGSPAWFSSAGGTSFSPDEKKLKFIVREPYYGKRIFTPKILQGEILENEKLIVESTRDFEGVISINDAVYDFNTGSAVEISLSKKPLKVLELD